MRAFAAAVWLTLASCSAALAGAQEDCAQGKDRDAVIRACTLIIEGRAKGDKAVAYFNRAGWSREQAIADYSRAIEINPNYAEAYKWRALRYSLADDHDRAIADDSRAIELDPNDAKAYNDRAGEYFAYKKD